MNDIARRACLKRIALAAISAVMPSVFQTLPAFTAETETQPAPSESEAAAIADIARETMEKCGVPGLSVAVARSGQFVYQRGFGFADKSASEKVTAASLFRIASVIKPIPSVAVFALIEQGRPKKG